MEKKFASGLVWFRRDLRVDDNAALYLALKSCRQVHCAFVFDRDILDPLPRADRRVEFIRESLVDLDAMLRQASGKPGAGLIVRHGSGGAEISALAQALGVQAVFAAHDYEPQAITRDHKVLGALANAGIALHTVKDQVVLERRELLTKAGSPYTVFTPYKNAWLARVDEALLRDHDSTPYIDALAPRPAPLRAAVPTLAQIGFASTNLSTTLFSLGPLHWNPGTSCTTVTKTDSNLSR